MGNSAYKIHQLLWILLKDYEGKALFWDDYQLFQICPSFHFLPHKMFWEKISHSIR